MNYQKITYPDINNGKGCRVTLWVSGCPNCCPGCHNSGTWGRLSGQEFNDEAFSELFSYIEKPYITGLTLSGGEPLDITDPEKLVVILNLVKKFRDRFSDTKDIWIFSGNQLEDLLDNVVAKEILSYSDYLVDGRFIESKKDKSLAFRGSSNQIIYKKNEFGIFEPDEELNNFRL